MRTLIRTNLAQNTRLVNNNTGWGTGGFGTGGVGISAAVREVGTGPGFENCCLNEWSTASTSGGSQVHYAIPVTVPTATIYSFSIWVQSNQTVSARIRTQVDASITDGLDIPLVAGIWQELKRENIAVPAGTTQVTVGGRINNLAGTTDGLKLRVTRPLIEPAASVGDFFDGSTLESMYLFNKWTGTPNASTSEQYRVIHSEGYTPSKALSDAKYSTIETILGPNPVMTRNGTFNDVKYAGLGKVLTDNGLI